MIGYLSFPSYPKSFKAKRKKLFNKVSKHKINEYIQRCVREIILEHELGRGKDKMEYICRFDNGKVKVTYDSGKFYVYVTENSKVYGAPIKADIEFEYAKDEYDREWKVRDAANENYKLSERTKEQEEIKANLMGNLISSGVLLSMLLVGFVVGLILK